MEKEVFDILIMRENEFFHFQNILATFFGSEMIKPYRKNKYN